MVTITHNGDFARTIKFLSNASHITLAGLDKFGADGVAVLSANTPVDSGLTAASWYYKIEESKGKTVISWCNSNIVDGVPIAVILQYGHATTNGGWVTGTDYINPAVKPLFDEIADLAWKEVNKY